MIISHNSVVLSYSFIKDIDIFFELFKEYEIFPFGQKGKICYKHS